VDFFSFFSALEKIGPYGGPAIMALLFYAIMRFQSKAHFQSLQAQERAYGSALEQHQRVLNQYEGNLTRIVQQQLQAAEEMREMYENNASLVKDFVALTQRFADRTQYLEKMIQLNIQSWQTAIKGIEDNQFCPRVKELGGKG
jgi:hypothetical protein